jgi:molybdate transport system substrate-binding protein
MFRASGLVVIAFLAIQASSAAAADLTILTAGAFKQVVMAAIPAYEHDTGQHVIVKNDTAGALVKRIDAGEAFDVLIVPSPVMKTLSQANRVVGNGTPLASVGVGVAIRTGTPAPDIATVAAFKQTLLNARKIAYIDPASGGSSGIYVVQLLQRLGIADALKDRSVLVHGGLVADKVADGTADLAVHQISELLPVKGVTVVGPLPEEIQSYTTYTGAVGSTSSEKDAAAAFLTRLTSPASQQVLAQKGMIAPR